MIIANDYQSIVIDVCLCYLLTTMLPGFLVEERRVMEKLLIVAMSLNILTESLDWKRLTVRFVVHMNDVDIYLIL